jgi:hypothetical protein
MNSIDIPQAQNRNLVQKRPGGLLDAPQGAGRAVPDVLARDFRRQLADVAGEES